VDEIVHGMSVLPVWGCLRPESRGEWPDVALCSAGVKGLRGLMP